MNENEVVSEYADTDVELRVQDVAEIALTPPEQQPQPEPIKQRNPNDWVTPNFMWREFTHSQTAVNRGLSNVPNNIELGNIKRTAEWLEKLRALLAEKYGKVIPIRITSGFRSERVNRAVGGSPTSAHRYGLAADIQAVGLPVKQLAYDIYSFVKAGKLPKPDQMIREMPRGGGQWVHIGLANGTQRGQWLVYEWSASKGKNAYTPVNAFFYQETKLG